MIFNVIELMVCIDVLTVDIEGCCCWFVLTHFVGFNAIEDLRALWEALKNDEIP